MNLKGEYNVPYGFREKEFLNEKTLLDVSNALQNAILRYGDFDLVRQNIKPNDLVFLDPPYTVSHNNNGFIKYNQKIFSLEDQIRLNSLIQYIKKKSELYGVQDKRFERCNIIHRLRQIAQHSISC